MKKNLIALLLAVVMASGSIGSVPALAAETTAEEAVTTEEEAVEEVTEIPEEADTAESVEEIEVEPEQDVTEEAEDGETTEETEAIEETKEESADIADTSAEVAEIEEPTLDDEEEEIETAGKDAARSEDADVVDSGECGENATWKLTGTDNNLTLIISGSGAMYDYSSDSSRPWSSKWGKIKSIVVEDGITRIGTCAFQSLRLVSDVSLCNGISSIGPGAFANCDSLTDITIPDGVTNIAGSTFNDCDSLTDITIPGSVMSIGNNAFEYCDNLTSVVISEGVMSLGDHTFEECTSLKSVTLPNSLTSIGKWAFFACESLTSITIPENITSIGENTFCRCTSLKRATLPNSVTSIGESAFSGCSNLLSIRIPDSVTDIEARAFSGCSNLKRVVLSNNLTRLQTLAFSGCTSLKRVAIPNSMTSIEWNVFSGCTSLMSVTIPDSVMSIGGYTFSGCDSLTNITIPESVVSIGDGAFGPSKTNTNVRYRGTKEQWDAVLKGNTYYKSIVYNYFSVDVDLILSGTSFYYTGKEIKPTVTVTHDGQELIEEIDYELVYKNNTNAGTASVEINGIDDYSGTVTETFVIDRKPVNKLTISGIATKIYNGKAQTQAVVVKNGDITLQRGTDYTVSYKNNTKVGTASLTITGKGNYTGSITKSFTIKYPPNTITAKNFTRAHSTKTQSFSLGVKVKSGTPTYKSSAKSVTVSKAGKVTIKANFVGKATITITAPAIAKKYSKTTKEITITVNPPKTELVSVTSPSAGKMTVKWKKNDRCDGYIIEYSTSSKFSDSAEDDGGWMYYNKTTSAQTYSCIEGKKYYVRVRTYKHFGRNTILYSDWSAVKTVTIKK